MFIQLRAIRRKKRMPKNLIRTIILISLLLTFFVTAYGSSRIDPILEEISEPAAINMINDTVNAAYTKFVRDTDIEYCDLVTITRAANGQITSIRTNADLINMMCIQINDEVSKNLNKANIKIKMPLGTLTGIDILSGKGPAFTLYLSQSNTVDTYTESSFREAGVNQTEHEILFFVTSKMTVILPRTTVTYDYEQSFAVAQSIIVGDVPDVWKK